MFPPEWELLPSARRGPQQTRGYGWADGGGIPIAAIIGGGAMVTEDQTAIIAFLASPSTHGGAPVERIDTHSAIVFLAGSRA